MLGMPHGSWLPAGPLITPGKADGTTRSKATVVTAPATIETTPPARVARFQARAASSAGVMATPYMV